jgi:signal transduction protein with GAF and PtsI domain
MTQLDEAGLGEVARSAVAIDGIASAAVFVHKPGSPGLELGAAAGIEGQGLDGLVAAVRTPGHPINRALADDGPTFDVRPMAPGGPALRSHLPLVVVRHERRVTVGVLAVAHERSLSADDRQALELLADAAADSIERDSA